MARSARRFRAIAWTVLLLALAGAAVDLPAQEKAAAPPARDPRDTPLYRRVNIHDPQNLFIPPLILKHVVQLPTPWEDPLALGQVEATGPVTAVSAEERAVSISTATFRITFTLEGPALHIVARRLGARDGEVFPSLTLKEPLPLHSLQIKEDPEFITLSSAAAPGVLCRIRRGDAALIFPWGPDSGAPEDVYRVVYSRRDQRLYVLAGLGPDDHVYGLGMKTGRLDRRDQGYVMWNSDTFGAHEAKDPVYASIPFYLLTDASGEGTRGVFVDDPSDVIVDFARTYAGQAFFSTANGQAGFYLFRAPRLRGVLADYQALTGTFPLPPAWALGYHQSAHTYFPAARVLEIAKTFRDKDIPCDALYLDIIHQDDYQPFTWNRQHFPDPPAMIRQLHDLGFRVLTIIDPGIKVDEDYPVFREGRKEGFFLRTDDGKLYANNIWPGYSAFPDFLQEKCRRWWAGWHDAYLRQGVDAFKNDMSEPATFNKTWSMLYYDEQTKMPGFLEEGTLDSNVVSRSREFGTVPHRFFHNAYGLYESLATWRAQEAYDDRRPFVLMRNTAASGQKSTYVWTGDTNSDWASLRLSLQMLLSLNLSGFPVSGADNGGFGGRCSAELYQRWTEFSTFSPFFRTHYFYVEQCLDKEPWAYGPEVESVIARYIRLRYRLLPYFYTAAWRAHEERAPLLRPMFYDWEGQPPAYAAVDQYLWGPDFLVAPVLEPGAKGRFVWLPPGVWYDFWTGTRWTSLGESRYVEAPLDTIPVWVRAGRIVPTMAPGHNSAAFPPAQLILEAYLLDGRAEGTAYLDDGATRKYQRGEWTRCDFRLAPDEVALALELNTTGPARFLPKSLALKLHGTPAECRTVRFRGQEIPVVMADGAPTATIDLK